MIEKIHSQCVNIQDRNSKSFNVVFFGHSNSGMQKNGNFCRILTFSPSIFTYIFFQIDIHIYTYLYIYTYALILLFSHSRTSFSLEKHILLLEGIISPLGKGHQWNCCQTLGFDTYRIWPPQNWQFHGERQIVSTQNRIYSQNDWGWFVFSERMVDFELPCQFSRESFTSNGEWSKQLPDCLDPRDGCDLRWSGCNWIIAL